jgi:UDP-glucose:(glucosyl)LPS alpha-1,2-glucosyltransferase
MGLKVTGIDDNGFALNKASPTIAVDEQSANAMGGTEMMKYGLYERLPDSLKDYFQIICSRVRELDISRNRILWLHDMWNDPEAAHLKDVESRARFLKMIFVSHWQFTTYQLGLGVPFMDGIVMKNAIEPIPTPEKKPSDGPLKFIYHTTPHRGLILLVPAFKRLAEEVDFDVHLDVFSSFEIYGWKERDRDFETLFQECRDDPNITYHGFQPNDVVRKALSEAHMFAYPNIWPETSCIAMMEAMSAGLSIVCPSLGALPETCANFATMYPYHEDMQYHIDLFYQVMKFTAENYWNEEHAKKLRFQKAYADSFYSWDLRIEEWKGLLMNFRDSCEQQQNQQYDIPEDYEGFLNQ